MNLLRTLGWGRIPRDAARLVPPESLVLTLEHLRASVTFRDLHRGPKYSAWRRIWFAGSFAISTDRIIAYRRGSRLINIPFSDPRFQLIDFSRSDSRTIELSHQASVFRPNWRGQIHYRFHSADAVKAVAELTAQAACSRLAMPHR